MYKLQRRIRQCRHPRCTAEAHAQGFCKVHQQERQAHANDPAEAFALLERGTTLDNQPLQSSRLRTELVRLQNWWDRACEAAKFGRDFQTMPVEESRAAVDWCLHLTQQMLMADRGQVPARVLDRTRAEVWGRLNNLERGLKSDGRARLRPLL